MSQFLSLAALPGILFSLLRRLFGFTADKRTMLALKDAKKLLKYDYDTIETGYGLASDGLMVVAGAVYMPNVTPEMIDWWFGWIRTTEQYKLWHPRDHVSSDWEGPLGSYVGGHHIVEERIGREVAKLKISFESPAKYFGPDWKRLLEEAGYGTAICGRTSVWNERRGGYMGSGHLLHLVKREEGGGCRMRSRFWLGDVEGSPVYLGNFVPEEMARGLMRHCVEEMSILAGILPGIYERENAKGKDGSVVMVKEKL